MEIIVYVSLFLTSSLIFYILYEAVLMPKQVVRERLDNVKVMADTRDAFDEEMRESFAERVINPVYERMIHALGNLAPSSIREQYEQLLSSSGTTRYDEIQQHHRDPVDVGTVVGLSHTFSDEFDRTAD